MFALLDVFHIRMPRAVTPPCQQRLERCDFTTLMLRYAIFDAAIVDMPPVLFLPH